MLMTHRILLRCTIALIAAGTLAACGSTTSRARRPRRATTAATATTAAAATTAKPATTAAPATTAKPTTTAAAATTAKPATTAAAPATTGGASTTGAPAGAASLTLHDDPTLGKILVDAEGFTVYLFTKDTSTTSVCTDKCLAAWPYAVANGTPTVGDGLDASKLTVSPQSDGTKQLTYNGADLLYRFAPDKAPGDTNGQGVQGVWFVVDASGNQVGG